MTIHQLRSHLAATREWADERDASMSEALCFLQGRLEMAGEEKTARMIRELFGVCCADVPLRGKKRSLLTTHLEM